MAPAASNAHALPEEILMPRIVRLLAAAALAALPFLATQALSADVRQTPAVSGFSGVRLAVPAKMEVIQGDTESAALEGSAEDLARVETVVEDGVLHIRAKERVNWSWNPKIRITVHAKRIESLAISGSGDIVAQTGAHPVAQGRDLRIGGHPRSRRSTPRRRRSRSAAAAT
jgi:hypothetical protein